MKKTEFLNELKEHLIGLPEDDVDEILEDYKEHFSVGKKKKRKESEICKSLGVPKQIAREARKELGKKTEDIDIKTHLIEVWVELKKFARKIFKEIKIIINNTSNKFQEFTGNKKEKKKTKTPIKKKKGEISAGRIILILLFNLLIFIQVWISLFAGIISLFISSFAIIISGAAVIGFSIFSLMGIASPILKDILFAGLFAGIGLVIFGGLLTDLFEELIKLYLKLTKGYLKLNMRLIRK